MSVKRKIKTLEALRSTLNVWEVIAVNRYKKYSSVVGAQLPYFLRLQEVLEHLYSLYSGVRIDLLELREEKNVDVLVLTSDRGYIGDFVTRTLKTLKSFIESKKDKNINLFLAGKKGATSRLLDTGAVVFEGVLTKDIDWDAVGNIKSVLVERFRKGFSDACYVIFQRPEVELGELIEIEERERREALLEESPFFYPKFEEVFKVKPMLAAERGRYRPVITRFLPADVRKRYSKEIILNIEAPEEAFIDGLLRLYISFFIKEVFLEHFTSINFARYRTISRILENIDRKLNTYRFVLNKLRQEKITKEIEDIVFAFLATEEKKLKSLFERGYILEIDVKAEDTRGRELKERLEKLGFPIREVRKRVLIGGFRLLREGEAIDLSVEGVFNLLRGSIKRRILRGKDW
ncbi:F-type H+-transporting ATPase subunit gamma [Hydrogenivirga caldilitoris]|uniref:F-type H+-transporting ATPase subunit gamma n=1 Tax=Hydrogenivirga caldilitoris TaxID=246264 RepID=A0A497XVE4_9AQUI|nr:F-type H+-transporting ATPase subunit gamma [Hydrogenivirga caldilitoris]